jgi:hypothetical protein
MTRIDRCFLVPLAFLAWTAVGDAATRPQPAPAIHVSPIGDDTNPGTAEKPVARLERAVALARALPPGAPRHIVLGAGDYLDASVSLTAQDSNLTIESAPGGRAKLVGGVRLSGWAKEGERFWSAPLPSDRTWDVRLLQVNGRFCPRARFPEEGTLTHLTRFDVPWMSSTGGGWKRKPTASELTTMKVKPGDLPAGLDLKNAEVTVFHMWDESVAGLTRLDADTSTLTLAPPLGHPPGAFGVQKYCFWNIKEGMTRPGQWYFDRGRGRIVYWPLAGEDMGRVTAVVPTRRSVIRASGVSNLTLRNLDIEVTTVPLITGGFGATAFDGAVQLERADGALLEGLHVAYVAGQGIKARGRQKPIRVVRSEVSSCGAGGVYLWSEGGLVENTLIHDVGLMYPSALGITGGGKGARLAHNEIHDTTYSAVAFSGEDIVMEHNLLYHCMKVLHDGAAIYTFASKNTRISDNVARDIVDTGGYGASAYYLDERSEGCVVERNIAIDVVRPSHNHMARNNTIRDNVFINHGDMTITLPRSSGFTVERNVFFATGKLTIEGVNAVTTWSHNLVNTGDGKVAGVVLNNYATSGKSTGLPGDTRAGDPLFVDLSRLDLHYRPGSPALPLGLKPLEMSQGGRQ